MTDNDTKQAQPGTDKPETQLEAQPEPEAQPEAIKVEPQEAKSKIELEIERLSNEFENFKTKQDERERKERSGARAKHYRTQYPAKEETGGSVLPKAQSGEGKKSERADHGKKTSRYSLRKKRTVESK